jgi:hypothetical protein
MTKAKMIETLQKTESKLRKKAELCERVHGEESEYYDEALSEWYVAYALLQDMGLDTVIYD